jgi:hypothetical protein
MDKDNNEDEDELTAAQETKLKRRVRERLRWY